MVRCATLAGCPLQHTRLIKCADDANTYLVNDISDPLQRSLTSLHLTDVLLGAPPPGASSTYAPASSERTCAQHHCVDHMIMRRRL